MACMWHRDMVNHALEIVGHSCYLSCGPKRQLQTCWGSRVDCNNDCRSGQAEIKRLAHGSPSIGRKRSRSPGTSRQQHLAPSPSDGEEIGVITSVTLARHPVHTIVAFLSGPHRLGPTCCPGEEPRVALA